MQIRAPLLYWLKTGLVKIVKRFNVILCMRNNRPFYRSTANDMNRENNA
jgi:hypothetical protein